MTWTVPKLNDCDPGIEPTEFMCLVAMATVPEKTTGGIVLPEKTRERQGWGADHALLIAASPFAFDYIRDWSKGRQPQPGDTVYVGKYAGGGDEIEGRDGKKYRLVDGRQITAVIERAAEPKLSLMETSNAA